MPDGTTLRPYRVICESTTPAERRYLSVWYPTLLEAQVAYESYMHECWDTVELVPPGAVPGVSITGKQLLVLGGRMRRRGGA